MPELTPIDEHDGWWAKREDTAGFTTKQAPSGAKLRQYLAMIATSPDNAVLIVGCSADSAMQVYVAHAAQVTGRAAYVVVPKRGTRTPATQWAIDHGANVTEVSTGYPSVYRAKARDIAKELGLPVVRWDLGYAATDTLAQVANIPEQATRIVVPTGSGLTAAAILAGVTARGAGTRVLAVCVSDLATPEKILATAARRVGHADPGLLDIVQAPSKYGKAVDAFLPSTDGDEEFHPLYGYLPAENGPRLDPYYAAKALAYVEPGDVLWVSGRRPE